MGNALVVSVYLLSLGMGFSIGANDAANALATSYGSDAAPLLVLLIGGAIFEWIGAFYCSGTVAAKLAANMIPNINSEQPMPEVQDQIMFSVSLAAFGFIMFASIFGMPISGTHTIVGALIGAGLAGLGGSAIDYAYMRRVILSWFYSPAVTSSLCFVLIVLVSLLTLNSGGARLKWRLFNTQLIAGFALAISTYMILILV